MKESFSDYVSERMDRNIFLHLFVICFFLFSLIVIIGCVVLLVNNYPSLSPFILTTPFAVVWWKLYKNWKNK